MYTKQCVKIFCLVAAVLVQKNKTIQLKFKQQRWLVNQWLFSTYELILARHDTESATSSQYQSFAYQTMCQDGLFSLLLSFSENIVLYHGLIYLFNIVKRWFTWCQLKLIDHEWNIHTSYKFVKTSKSKLPH